MVPRAGFEPTTLGLEVLLTQLLYLTQPKCTTASEGVILSTLLWLLPSV